MLSPAVGQLALRGTRKRSVADGRFGIQVPGAIRGWAHHCRNHDPNQYYWCPQNATGTFLVSPRPASQTRRPTGNRELCLS